MKMEHTECSETSAYKLQTPCNYPKESIQHTEHGESLKSRNPSILEFDELENNQNGPLQSTDTAAGRLKFEATT